MRTARKVLEVPLSARDRRRLLRLAQSGVELRRLEWVFTRPGRALEAALETARREIARPARPPPAANDNRAASRPRAAPIEAALATLGRRAAETGAGLWLDGARVGGAQLVAAARALGADIPYPGIAAPPRAFHTGPSARPARRGGRAIARDERPPGPSTAAKPRRDVIRRLADRGALSAAQLRAAGEIRQVWEAVGRGLFARARPLAPRIDRSGRGPFAGPVALLSDGEERAWRLRYRPWAREMALTVAAGGLRASRLQIVLDVVVDNHGVRQVEGWYRMRHGGALAHVGAALHRYAEIAGWTDAPHVETRAAAAWRVNPANRIR